MNLTGFIPLIHSNTEERTMLRFFENEPYSPVDYACEGESILFKDEFFDLTRRALREDGMLGKTDGQKACMVVGGLNFGFWIGERVL